MTRDRRRGDWAYVSLLGAVPASPLPPRVAVAAQFLLFEGAAVGVAWRYGLWGALPVATVAVGVATLGSLLMIALTDRVRDAPAPDAYARLLFGPAVDVVLGLLAFAGLVTYLVVEARGPSPGVVRTVLGPHPPAPAVFLGLLVAWDLCYRIGTGWWASVVGLWRSLARGDQLSAAARRRLAAVDGLTVAFAGLQLALVPFLLAAPPLAALVVGHVLAVALVSSTSVLLLRRAADTAGP